MSVPPYNVPAGFKVVYSFDSEFVKYDVELSGNGKRFNVVFGHLVDIVRKAQRLHKVRAHKESYRKIRKAIKEGKLIRR